MSIFNMSIDAAIDAFMDDERDIIHIVPKNGSKHEEHRHCWCIPDIEECEHTLIVTHYTEH